MNYPAVSVSETVGAVYNRPPCLDFEGAVIDRPFYVNHSEFHDVRTAELLHLARRRLTDSFGKFFLFRRNAEGFRNFYPWLQLNNARLGFPGFRVGLGIIDREVELNRVAIDAAVTLDGAHLLTVWLALRAQPGLIIEPGGFHNQRISFPPADGIPIPSRVGIFRKLAAIHPDLPDRVLSFKEHQDPSGNMDNLERPDDEKNPRDTYGRTFQDRIVATRGGSRTVSRLVGVVPGLTPWSKRRKIVSRALTAAAGCKLPDARQVVGVKRSLPHLPHLPHQEGRKHQRRCQRCN